VNKIIKDTLVNRWGEILPTVYEEMDDEEIIETKGVSVVHGFCFYRDKLLVVYSDKKRYWSPPGGGVEKGENIFQATKREIAEESNMKVLKHKLLGCFSVEEGVGKISNQARFACLVEPYGDFISDPDGDIDKIELIDLADVKKYFDWGKIGDHILAQALAWYESLSEEK